MRKTGTSVAIYSTKGGVGKTILTLNLAGILEKACKKVLIIDLDLSSGGISMSINKNINKSIYDVEKDFQTSKLKDIKEYVIKYDEYIDVLSSPKDPREANLIEGRVVERIIKKAEYHYDVVLIDMSHELIERNLLAIDTSTKLLMVMNNDPLNIKSMRSFLTILDENNIDNYKVVLYNAKDILKQFFTEGEIESLIGAKIDYKITEEFYLKNIDEYIMNGKIPSLNDKAIETFEKDYPTLMQIAASLMEVLK